MERQGHSLPVLVGGAVVEWYSTGAYMSGDFDLHVLAPEPFTDALLALGFRAEDRPGRLLRGFYHPDFDLGVEFISGRLLDGYAERARAGVRIKCLRVPDAGDVAAVVVSELFCSSTLAVESTTR